MLFHGWPSTHVKWQQIYRELRAKTTIVIEMRSIQVATNFKSQDYALGDGVDYPQLIGCQTCITLS